MKKICITGNIGSGKSWVCALFESKGIPVFYSDNEAKRLYYRDDIKKVMTERFGNDIYQNDGSLDKAKLSRIIFSNPEARDFVEQHLYPALNQYFFEWAEQQEAPYVLYETALVFEKHLEHLFGAIILVSASESTRLHRVMLRDHCDEATVRRRMAAQWSESEKRKHSDFIIIHENDEEDDYLLEQIVKIDSCIRFLDF